MAASPGEAALLKGGRAKVRAQPLLSTGPSWQLVPGERRSSKEGAQKSARDLSFHWPFLAASPGRTALLKGGRAKVCAQPFLPLVLAGRQSRGKRRSSKEGAQKSARGLFFPLALPCHQSRWNGSAQRRARKSPRATFPFTGPSSPPVPGERRSSKEGAQKSARSLFFPLALRGRQSRGSGAPQRRARKSPRAASSFHWRLPGHQSRGNGAPQRRARKSPRAASSIHWPFLATSPWGTALLKGGRAKVRAQPLPSIGPSWPPVPGERRSSKEGAQKSARSLFFPLALPRRQSRGKRLLKRGRAKVRARPFLPLAVPGHQSWGNDAPQRRARKSPRAASPFHWPFLATSPRQTALPKGGRAKVRARAFLPLALPGCQFRGKRRSSKEGAQKSARSLFLPWGPSWSPVPGERRSSKEGAQKSARSLFFPLALSGHQPRGNGAPQRRARKSPRAASSIHWPFLATSPWGTALLKGGRAKVRAQPLPSIGPSWPPVPGERRSSKEGAQKSARDLSFHWPFLAASPGRTALLKGGRAKVCAQPFLPLVLAGRQSRGKRRSSKEGAQKSARGLFFPLALPCHQSRWNGSAQRRARKSPRATFPFTGPSSPPVPGGTALLKGGRAKVRAQPLLSIGPSWPPVPGKRRSSKEGAQKSARSLFFPLAPSWPPVPGERRSSKEGAQKSARSLFHPLALPGHQSPANGAPQRGARKSPRATFPSIGPSWLPVPGEAALLKGGRAKVRAQPLPSMGPSWSPVPGERHSSKEGAQKSARSLFFPLALSGHQPRGNGAPQRRARKSPRAASSIHWPFLATSPWRTALLKGGRAKARAQPLPSIGPSWPPVPGERRSSKEGAQKSARSLFFPLALPRRQSRGKRLLKGGRAKVRARPFLPLAVPGHQSWGNDAPQRRARKSPRAASPFHWPFLATSPRQTALPKGGRAKVRARPFLPLALPGCQFRGKRRSSKEGAQKSARSLFLPWALPGHQSGGMRSSKEARKSPRAASSFHWPFLATSPGGTALLKGGRAKVRAQPLLSTGPSWSPVPGEASPQRRARKSPRANFPLTLSGHQPRETALLKGGRAKVRAQPLLSIGPSWPPVPGERPLLKGGRAKVRARPLSFHWPFLAPNPGGTALLKGGRAKVRARALLSTAAC